MVISISVHPLWSTTSGASAELKKLVGDRWRRRLRDSTRAAASPLSMAVTEAKSGKIIGLTRFESDEPK